MNPTNSSPSEDPGRVGSVKPKRLVRIAKRLLRESKRLRRKGRKRLEPSVQQETDARVGVLSGLLPARRGDPVDVNALYNAIESLETYLASHYSRWRKGRTRKFLEPVIWAIVIGLVVRSFVFGIYRIPSSSMFPTLLKQDLLLITKLEYGLYVPFSPSRLVSWSQPERGEVIVFELHDAEGNARLTMIKRVVAISGDRVALKDGTIHLNGQAIPTRIVEDNSPCETLKLEPGHAAPSQKCACIRQEETLGGGEDRSTWDQTFTSQRYRSSCSMAMPNWPITTSRSEFTVPEGHVFVMGDNRDHSRDSRSWGPLPEGWVYGRAFVIWWARDLGRVFSSL